MLGRLTEPVASRLVPVWVTVCVAAVMGPYLVSGLRTEQLGFYGSAAFVVLTQGRLLLHVLGPVRWLLALWGTYAAVAVIGGLMPVRNATPWESGSLLAGIDNALLPLATLITVAYWCYVHTLPRLMSAVARVVAVAMCLNAILALLGCLLGLGSLPWLRLFWAADGSSTYVAELAQQMGRFSGVFNQPAEAGIAYTLAAFALAYLQKRGLATPLWANVGWVLVVVGGMLTLSKVFVGGLVVALVLVLLYRVRVVRTGMVAFGTVGTMVALSAAGWFPAWGASTMAGWYRSSIEAGDSPLYTLTAGRFGSAGTTGPPSIAVPVAPTEGAIGGTEGGAEAAPPTGVGELARVIYDEHPVFGVGARGLQVAYDSAWSEALVVGGLAGLTLVVLVHLLVVASSLLHMRTLDRVHALLLVAVLVLMLAGSMGMPALTGNRESTLLWIFIVALGFAGRVVRAPLDQQHAKTGDPPADERADRPHAPSH